MAQLNKDLLDTTTRAALDKASDTMRQLGKPLLMPELALLAILRMPESTAFRAIGKLAETRGFKPSELEKEVETQVRTREGRSANFSYLTEQNVTANLSDEMLVVLDEARSIALASGEIYIATEHLLGALSQTGVSTAGLLQKRGVTPTALASLMLEGVISKRSTTNDWVDDAKHGKLSPVFTREGLLRDLTGLLSLAQDRHVLLVGQPGSGRRSLVQALAFQLAEGNGNASLKNVVEVSESAWLDNPTLAVQVGLKQAQHGVLFIPNIHRFFDRAARTEATAKELLKAFVQDGSSAIIIGTTTDGEFTDKLKPTTIASNAQILNVPPAPSDESQKILSVLKPQFERDYAMTIGDDAIKSAVSLASRYIGGQPLPGSAVQVLHRACAIARSASSEVRATNETPALDPRPSSFAIDAEDVTLAISVMTGIPVTKLGADERTKYAQMTQALQGRVLGQDDAVLALSRAVKSARVGLKDPKRPIGSFLFLGPSGVGKTELAKALAEFMFGNEEALVAIDMSEYQKDDTINRLIGAPPGYVGYEGGGQLTDRVIKSPYAVVVFDEVEKAHPRVLDILLQVMEEGRLTDGQGRVANFAESVIILTSNLGAVYLNDATINFDQAKDLAMGDVRSFFRPEFLNRLDDVVMFKPLSAEVLAKVLDLMISKEAKLAQTRGITLEVTPAARVWLLAQNTEINMGARPLRRILQRNVREKLADYLLTLETPPSKVVVDVEVGALVYHS
jgi:ATP-dependent Clp protease ATP-binding subunit ClpC